MAQRPHTPLILLAVLFALTLGAVRWFGTPGRTLDPDVRAELPAAAGEWRATNVLYCQNEPCMAASAEDRLENAAVCPRCGGALDVVALSERKILPPGTAIRRKLYRRPDGAEILVSVVVTGEQRAGIHRPQWCLPSQGYRILASRTVRATTPEGRPLRVMFLDVARPDPAGGRPGRLSGYAYWFIGHGRQTPYHAVRLFYGAWDSIFRGANARWAYVSVFAGSASGGPDCAERIRQFLSVFSPLAAAD